MGDHARLSREHGPEQRDSAEAQRHATPRATGASAHLGNSLSRASTINLHRLLGNHVVAQLAQGEAALKPAKSPTSNTASADRAVESTERGERSRTTALIRITGHASPRWRSARTSKSADERNRRLSENRAQSVRLDVQKRLRELLPEHEITFEYVYESTLNRETVDPINDSADVRVEEESQGSSHTLTEAGRRGLAG